jgi:hypothetical protein
MEAKFGSLEKKNIDIKRDDFFSRKTASCTHFLSTKRMKKFWNR